MLSLLPVSSISPIPPRLVRASGKKRLSGGAAASISSRHLAS